MKNLLLLLLLAVSGLNTSAQLYFPPNNSSTWETTDPTSLGWCQSKIDSLYQFLETNDTKAFILLKDGKIVLEKYLNGHNQSSNWYWASAGKTLTSTLIGIAQQEKLLDISDPTSKYLGKGWTSCTPDQENKITIKNQLSMTSGLDDGVPNSGCTLSSCLVYKSDAGTRWAYHNGPYTLLDGVIENATGVSMNIFNTQKIKNVIGMDGLFIKQDFNNVYFSTARSMARFGLMILNKGNWNGVPVLSDENYYNEMVNTSQIINESYGYLWWLNGKNSFMIPQSQIKFPGTFFKSAPADMFSALGKNGQFINVIPSLNMVWIRMGDDPSNVPVPFFFNEDMWKYINDLSCTSSTKDHNYNSVPFKIYPNPVSDLLHIETISIEGEKVSYKIMDAMGKVIREDQFHEDTLIIDTQNFPSGVYLLVFQTPFTTSRHLFVKQ